ncbi:MAG: stage III sporulation protein AD [Clostridia bacterium]|nr:stage III sporulation protein AD [Clostridia bacterium]
MEIVKIAGIGLISLIVIVVIKQYRPEFAVYVSIIAGLLIMGFVISKLSGIIEILRTLANKASLNSSFLGILIKVTGIAILTEFTASICKDAGEGAITTKVDLGGKVIIMSMSIPIISSLLETILKILP